LLAFSYISSTTSPTPAQASIERGHSDSCGSWLRLGSELNKSQGGLLAYSPDFGVMRLLSTDELAGYRYLSDRGSPYQGVLTYVKVPARF